MQYVSNFRALISTYRWNGMAPSSTPVFVTYSFLTNAEVPRLADYEPYDNSGYFSFTAAQKANFRKAVAHYAEQAGIRFIEVDDPDDAMVKVMNTDGSNWGGWANYGSGTRGDTSTGYLVIDNAGPYAPGSYAYETILHELGHVSGLKHPFEGPIRLATGLDNQNHTLMSYTGNGRNDTALAHFDTDALRHLYGDSGAVKAAWSWWFNNDTHTFHLRGSPRGDKLIGTDTDTKFYARGGNDAIFGRDEDDTAFGHAGNDRFMLGLGNNIAYGGAGNDVFYDYWGNDLYGGGPGSDTVNFTYATAGVFVDLGSGLAQNNLGQDRYVSIEHIVAGRYGDQILGSDIRNIIKGLGGADVLVGAGGNDVLYGGVGNDELDGGNGADVLVGGNGKDVLTGAAGSDIFKFHPNQGEDVITDFVDGEDRVMLRGFGFANIAQARARFHEIGTPSDDQVGFDYRGSTIVIHGADLADITIADILI
jgi:serralysin